MSLTLPNFGALQSHKLRNAAERIVERVDFGRQRAVMTGVPHRLAVDLDAGTYKLEWQGADAGNAAPQPKPMLEPDDARNYPPAGYLQKRHLPEDPWGNFYEYEQPGQNNSHSFDLWSYGADEKPGGEGVSADIGNWDEGGDRN